MAFVFDATPSSLTANSYVTVEEADDYFTAHQDFETWDDLTTERKQAFLVQATRRIDSEYFGGRKKHTNQNLEWPRLFIYDKDGFPRADDSIPKELKFATFELALYYIEECDRMVSKDQLEDVESYKVQGVQVTLKKGRKADQFPQIVDLYIRGIGPGAWRGKRFPSQASI